jgi:YD repeat-containing protein
MSATSRRNRNLSGVSAYPIVVEPNIDPCGRTWTYTDAAGWTVTYDYDAADRIARITYPDGTAQRYTWDRLDLAAYQTGSAGCGAMRTTPIGG